MTSLLLLRLLTEEFHDSIGVLLPPAALRRQLVNSSDVRALATGIRFGEVTADETREFVGMIMKEFRPGEYFHNNLALAALAVAMETWSSEFVEEYLLDLARLTAPELNISARIARECIKKRFALPKNDLRVLHYPRRIAPRFTSRGMRMSELPEEPAITRLDFLPKKYARSS